MVAFVPLTIRMDNDGAFLDDDDPRRAVNGGNVEGTAAWVMLTWFASLMGFVVAVMMVCVLADLRKAQRRVRQ